jgi:uncharacterized membrane protein AbrB (regulator of aidB expression)
MLIMIAAAMIGWKLGERIGLFGAPILGPMILTGALSLLDVIHYRPPAEAILAAQFLIGLGIGVGYVGVTLGEIRRDVTAGVIFVAPPRDPGRALHRARGDRGPCAARRRVPRLRARAGRPR